MKRKHTGAILHHQNSTSSTKYKDIANLYWLLAFGHLNAPLVNILSLLLLWIVGVTNVSTVLKIRRPSSGVLIPGSHGPPDCSYSHLAPCVFCWLHQQISLKPEESADLQLVKLLWTPTLYCYSYTDCCYSLTTEWVVCVPPFLFLCCWAELPKTHVWLPDSTPPGILHITTHVISY